MNNKTKHLKQGQTNDLVGEYVLIVFGFGHLSAHAQIPVQSQQNNVRAMFFRTLL